MAPHTFAAILVKNGSRPKWTESKSEDDDDDGPPGAAFFFQRRNA